jgi:hypothetical protein
VGAELELEWVREYGHAIRNIGDGEGEARGEGAVFYFAEGTEQVSSVYMRVYVGGGVGCGGRGRGCGLIE